MTLNYQTKTQQKLRIAILQMKYSLIFLDAENGKTKIQR